jgi:hypothetical protein
LKKSRDCGIFWLAMATSVSLCFFSANLTIGVGSAKEELVDRSDDPACLLWKARMFLFRLLAAKALFRPGAQRRQQYDSTFAVRIRATGGDLILYELPRHIVGEHNARCAPRSGSNRAHWQSRGIKPGRTQVYARLRSPDCGSTHHAHKSHQENASNIAGPKTSIRSKLAFKPFAL